MSLTRKGKLRRALRDKNYDKAREIRERQQVVDDNPVGEGCEDCPEHCTAALCGDKCADKCYKKPDTKIYPSRRDSDSSDSDDSSVNTGQPKYGGRKTRRKTRRKRRKKRRKSRKMRKKTKRKRKRKRKKSKKVRRK